MLLPVREPFPELDSNRSSDHQHKAGRTGGSSDDHFHGEDIRDNHDDDNDYDEVGSLALPKVQCF